MCSKRVTKDKKFEQKNAIGVRCSSGFTIKESWNGAVLPNKDNAMMPGGAFLLQERLRLNELVQIGQR